MKIAIFLISIFFCFSNRWDAFAAERIALVIANENYRNIDSLKNPSADAKLISKSLENAGYVVFFAKDVVRINFTEFLKDMTDFFRNYIERENIIIESILFYYAGHAVQLDGVNYFLPVDAGSEIADVKTTGVSLNIIIDMLSSIETGNRIIVLDACRNNPYNDSKLKNGLAELVAPINTYISFSTQPGGVALDGSGANSPFAASLHQRMREVNLPIEQMFKSVRSDVFEETEGQQIPWDSSSLTNEYKFLPTSQFGHVELEQTFLEKETNLWREKVQNATDRKVVEAFLRIFPSGFYADEARKLLESLK